ncbi:TPA: hypothetical protein EYP70_04135 [Candidatus Bathyarchaeota archaeon]|nr:hypothetical protein [Candidatus Bathyarchaeota archaeon]
MNRFYGCDDVADANSNALTREFKRIGDRFPERARRIVDVAKVIRNWLKEIWTDTSVLWSRTTEKLF